MCICETYISMHCFNQKRTVRESVMLLLGLLGNRCSQIVLATDPNPKLKHFFVSYLLRLEMNRNIQKWAMKRKYQIQAAIIMIYSTKYS